MIYVNKKDNNFIATCNCGCGNGFEFVIDEDKDIFINCITNKFYSEQDTFFKKLKSKFKIIGCILKNKEYRWNEICMSKEDWKDFKEAIDEINNKVY